MMQNAKFAIVEPNVLTSIGLKQLLNDIIPVIDIDIFQSFESLCENEESYIHYFISSRIYFENIAFFRESNHRPIVLVSANIAIKGVVTLNICQTEQSLAKSIMGLMQHGHHGSDKAPGAALVHKPEIVLSPRETEVAILLAKGFINKEIADKLNISITTVISHRKSIMEKLNARSLADITIFCILNGFIDIVDK